VGTVTCLFCGKSGLRYGKWNEVSREHVLKASLLESLGLKHAPIQRDIHSAADGITRTERHKREAGGFVQPDICTDCNKNTFNEIDKLAEPLIRDLAVGNLRIRDLQNENREALAWSALKVAILTDLGTENRSVPAQMNKLLLAKFRDGQAVSWPANTVAYVARLPSSSYANAVLNGMPVGYYQGYPHGQAFVSGVRYSEILVGIAGGNSSSLEPVFVDGIHQPFFPDRAFFQKTQIPLIPKRYLQYPRPSWITSGTVAIGFPLSLNAPRPEIWDKFRDEPGGLGVPLPPIWRAYFSELRNLGKGHLAKLVGQFQNLGDWELEVEEDPLDP
jgi:hypothetical protein